MGRFISFLLLVIGMLAMGEANATSVSYFDATANGTIIGNIGVQSSTSSPLRQAVTFTTSSQSLDVNFINIQVSSPVTPQGFLIQVYRTNNIYEPDLSLGPIWSVVVPPQDVPSTPPGYINIRFSKFTLNALTNYALLVTAPNQLWTYLAFNNSPNIPSTSNGIIYRKGGWLNTDNAFMDTTSTYTPLVSFGITNPTSPPDGAANHHCRFFGDCGHH